MSNISSNEFRRIGSSVFGEVWVPPLARRLGYTPQYIRMLAAGKRPITPAITVRLELVCRRRIKALDRWHERLSQFVYAGEPANG